MRRNLFHILIIPVLMVFFNLSPFLIHFVKINSWQMIIVMIRFETMKKYPKNFLCRGLDIYIKKTKLSVQITSDKNLQRTTVTLLQLQQGPQLWMIMVCIFINIFWYSILLIYSGTISYMIILSFAVADTGISKPVAWSLRCRILGVWGLFWCPFTYTKYYNCS